MAFLFTLECRGGGVIAIDVKDSYSLDKARSTLNPSLGWPTKAGLGLDYGFPYQQCGAYGNVTNNGYCPDYISEKSLAPPPPDCTTVDFRSVLPPVRNQDSIGWCFAFTAADLISFKIGKEVSSADIALSSEASKDGWLSEILSAFLGGDMVKSRATDNGGLINDAVESGKTKGFCLEKDLPSRDTQFADLRSTLNSLVDLKKKYAEAKGKGLNGKEICSLYMGRVNTLFPNVQLTDLQAVLDASSSKTIFDRLADLSCGSRIKVPHINVQNTSFDAFDPPSKKASSIDSILDDGRPVGIGYNPDVLQDPSINPLVTSGHASSIVGRRWDAESKTCNYLLRNSWGTSCAGYHFSYKCESGYVWIPKNTLSKAVGHVNYIQ